MTLSDETFGEIERGIEGSSREMQDFFMKMLRINAVNPKGGGRGEKERADFLEEFMRAQGLEVTRVDVRDEESGGLDRPSLSTSIKGKDEKRTLWFISHMDTVPEGSAELWQTDPFGPVIKDGKIIARGSEDNGQSLVASLWAIKELARQGVPLPFNVGVWFVADEEAGSEYGIKHLLAHSHFHKEDLVVVPDAGSKDGSEIELAEKGLLWLKITTKGRQVHASQPRKGLNAYRIGMKLTLDIDETLRSKYRAADGRFAEPRSTFEPTKKEANVQNVNTIPGVDVSYFDCRVLPEYNLDSIVSDVRTRVAECERTSGATISLEVVQQESAGPATPEASEVARLVAGAVRRFKKIEPKFVGIGGQTVGNLFRKEGISTAVWSTVDEVAHEPNEYCRVKNLLDDSKVFAAMPLIA